MWQRHVQFSIPRFEVQPVWMCHQSWSWFLGVMNWFMWLPQDQYCLAGKTTAKYQFINVIPLWNGNYPASRADYHQKGGYIEGSYIIMSLYVHIYIYGSSLSGPNFRESVLNWLCWSWWNECVTSNVFASLTPAFDLSLRVFPNEGCRQKVIPSSKLT